MNLLSEKPDGIGLYILFLKLSLRRFHNIICEKFKYIRFYKKDGSTPSFI